MRVRFGEFVFDRDRRELSRNGGALHLTRKAFELLDHLIARRPAAVSQEELFDKLWPETLVDTSRIHQLVQEIRTTLGDDERRIIRTVHGHGYAFDAASTVNEHGATLWQIVVGPVIYTLFEGENLVGRDPRAVVKIESGSVSRRHALLHVRGDNLTVEDLGSRNGTIVEGRRIETPAPARAGDHLRFGAVDAVVRVLPPLAETGPLDDA